MTIGEGTYLSPSLYLVNRIYDGASTNTYAVAQKMRRRDRCLVYKVIRAIYADFKPGVASQVCRD